MTNIISQRPVPPPMERLDSQVKIETRSVPLALQRLPQYTIINADVTANTRKFITEVASRYGKLSIKTNLILTKNMKITLQVLRVMPQLELIIKKLNNIPINSLNLSRNLNEVIDTAHQSYLKIQKPSLNNTNNSIVATKRPLTTPINITIGSTLNAVLIRAISKSSIVKTVKSEQIKTASDLSENSSKTTANLSATHRTKAQIKNSLKKSRTGPNNLIINDTRKSSVLITAEKIFQHIRSSFSKVTGDVSSFNPEKLSTQHQFGVKKLLDKKKQVPRHTTMLKDGTRFSIKFIGLGDTHTKNIQHPATIPKNMTGIIIAQTPLGQPILNTPLGMIVLETPALLQSGQILNLEIIPDTIAVPAVNSAILRFESIFRGRQWQNLVDVINELDQVPTIDTQKLITSKLPQPNAQLTLNTLFFLNALKGGDIRSWLGNTVASVLDQIKPGLLMQLNEDFVHLGRAVVEPQLNDWRSALIPFFTTLGLDQFQMHTQRHASDGRDKKMEDCSRFIIDIVLSRLGRFQIDGLVREKGKRLDLVLRSENTLPQQIRGDINNIFKRFTGSTDVVGEIIFQADQTFAEVSMPRLGDHSNKVVFI